MSSLSDTYNFFEIFVWKCESRCSIFGTTKQLKNEQSNRRITPMGSTCPKCGESEGNE